MQFLVCLNLFQLINRYTSCLRKTGTVKMFIEKIRLIICYYR